MPTYGYRCSDCKNEFEIFQKMTDAALTTCEKCGGVLKKILYPVGISFKGEGFYVNDSAKKSSEGPKAAAKPEGSTSVVGAVSTPTEGKTETKTETPAAAPAAPAASADAKP